MKILIGLVAVLVLALPLLNSCSTLRTGQAVKAASEAKEGEPLKASYEVTESKGWANRYIPGWKRLSNALPPPTEARKEWDRWQRNGGRPGLEPEKPFP
jgi:hypothetical protein